MSTQQSSTVSRRTAIAAIAAGGVTLTGHRIASASAQASGPLADHPLAGMWMAMANPPLPESPKIPAPSSFGADGTFLAIFPVTQMGENEVQFNSDLMGTWESYDDMTGHFTAVQILSDAEGTFLGTVTIDGHPRVNDDGMTFTDDGSLNTVTIRDASGTVVNIIPPGTPSREVTAMRMGVEMPGFPEGTPGAGTPMT